MITRQKVAFICTIPHIAITLQKIFKDMRLFSILLLLISIPFIAMDPNNLSKHKSKRLVFKKWQTQHRRIVPIPIEATLNEN